jgi:transposase
MNIVADELCDVIRETARGPFGARPNCGLWSSERCALFIRVSKVTSKWKERLTQQLLDGDLEEYIMQKEQWMTHAFNDICSKRNETASKLISNARQASPSKMCHNLRFTGARHELWYGEAKPCCMCGQHEDWRHVLTCKSLDAEQIIADSWSKLNKQMDKWSLPSDT